ncbi:MAG: hypothetical protein H0W67_05340 [Gemmatimonadales bacterium]|nr:hypothetical protein [Gemmatimonadales bacterium]
MSGPSGWDIRVPIGGLFTALGAIIGGYGLATLGDADRYAASFGVNVNLWWGAAMLVFGLLMLAAARMQGRSSAAPAVDTFEGRATEGREHHRGLER